MWKESYRIGIDVIDHQHMQLFLRVSLLLKAMERGAGPEEFEDLVEFLKKYVVFHFANEERYQEEIQYPLRAIHRREHRNFTGVVMNYQQRLEETGYNLDVVKELAGMLTSWLIYHVANTDLDMVRGTRGSEDYGAASPVSMISSGVLETLGTLAGFEISHIEDSKLDDGGFRGDLAVSIRIFGDVNGTLQLTYSREFALNLVGGMTGMTPNGLDELVCSALAEVANISLGNAAVRFSNRGQSCDITTPDVLPVEEIPEKAGMVYNSRMGWFKISIDLDEV